METGLIPALANPQTAIETIETVEQARTLANAASSAAAFFKAQGDEENAQRAKAVSLWSQRKAGELLQGMEKNPGGRPVTGERDEPVSDTPTLADLDISKHESSRWQLLAGIPESEFAAFIDGRLARGYELTAGSLVQLARSQRDLPQTSQPDEPEVERPKKKRAYLVWLESAHMRHTSNHNHRFDECPDRVCVLARDVELMQKDQADLLLFLKHSATVMRQLGAGEERLQTILALIAKVEGR